MTLQPIPSADNRKAVYRNHLPKKQPIRPFNVSCRLTRLLRLFFQVLLLFRVIIVTSQQQMLHYVHFQPKNTNSINSSINNNNNNLRINNTE
jgi:hypothetical protein